MTELMKKSHLFSWLLIFGLILLVVGGAVVLIPLWGVPSVDDWVYAYTVRSMVEAGVWEVPIISNPLALPQIVLGIVLSKIYGGFYYPLLWIFWRS